jgi:hypothetical protein
MDNEQNEPKTDNSDTPDEDDHDETTNALAIIDHFCEQGSSAANASRVVFYHIDRTPVPGDMFAASCAQMSPLGETNPGSLWPYPADGRTYFGSRVSRVGRNESVCTADNNNSESQPKILPRMV